MIQCPHPSNPPDFEDDIPTKHLGLWDLHQHNFRSLLVQFVDLQIRGFFFAQEFGHVQYHGSLMI
jgi:hypothetical protein